MGKISLGDVIGQGKRRKFYGGGAKSLLWKPSSRGGLIKVSELVIQGGFAKIFRTILTAASNFKRLKQCVVKHFVVNQSILFSGCVQSINQYYFQVVFNLHTDFPKPERTVRKPPYCVKARLYSKVLVLNFLFGKLNYCCTDSTL